MVSGMIAIADVGVGNFRSVHSMLRTIGYSCSIVTDPRALSSCQALILPGVGAFDNGMRKLRDSGFAEVLGDTNFVATTPILGVCLGMHLLAKTSEEGEESGLGLIEDSVVKLANSGRGGPVRVPHVGWAEVTPKPGSVLLSGFSLSPRFYFCHSYRYAGIYGPAIAGTTYYGSEFPAVVEAGNLYGVQVHPEKSHSFGMQVLRNFANAAGVCAEYE